MFKINWFLCTRCLLFYLSITVTNVVYNNGCIYPARFENQSTIVITRTKEKTTAHKNGNFT